MHDLISQEVSSTADDTNPTGEPGIHVRYTAFLQSTGGPLARPERSSWAGLPPFLIRFVYNWAQTRSTKKEANDAVAACHEIERVERDRRVFSRNERSSKTRGVNGESWAQYNLVSHFRSGCIVVADIWLLSARQAGGRQRRALLRLNYSRRRTTRFCSGQHEC